MAPAGAGAFAPQLGQAVSFLSYVDPHERQRRVGELKYAFISGDGSFPHWPHCMQNKHMSSPFLANGGDPDAAGAGRDRAWEATGEVLSSAVTFVGER